MSRGSTPRHAQTAGDFFAMQFILLKLCGIKHSMLINYCAIGEKITKWTELQKIAPQGELIIDNQIDASHQTASKDLTNLL